MAIMITGGTGFLGSYLVCEQVRTDIVLFEKNLNVERIRDIHDKVTIVQGVRDELGFSQQLPLESGLPAYVNEVRKTAAQN